VRGFQLCSKSKR